MKVAQIYSHVQEWYGWDSAGQECQRPQAAHGDSGQPPGAGNVTDDPRHSSTPENIAMRVVQQTLEPQP